MKNGPIYSAFVGAGICAAAIGLEISIPIALGAGIASFVASNLILSDNSGTDSQSMIIKSTSISEMEFDDIISNAQKQNAIIYSYTRKIEDPDLVVKIDRLHEVIVKIINAVKKSPKKIKNAEKFFSYYLPTTVNFLQKYDEIENQNTGTKEAEEFMRKSAKMIDKIEIAFKTQLSNLYKSDMMESDAEMKLFDTMLKTDGMTGEDDFKL